MNSRDSRGSAGPEPPQIELYGELRRLAGSYMRRERGDHTLQPTALVNEAWLRLSKDRAIEGSQRTAFLAAGAATLRRILCDHARRRQALRRSGNRIRVELDAELLAEAVPLIQSDQLVELDVALEELFRLSERQAKVVELKFFGGLSNQECAEALQRSLRTIELDWQVARAWLRRRLAEYR